MEGLIMRIRQNVRGVAYGFDNMYYIEMEGGEWKLIDRWSRPHDCKPILCDFILAENEKNGKKLLLGSSANSNRWIGREVDSVDSWSLDQMAEYLEA
jgi:hypothetical protein